MNMITPAGCQTRRKNLTKPKCKGDSSVVLEHSSRGIINMGKSDMPDMYAQSPRAVDIHIRQIMSAYYVTLLPIRV